MAKAWTKKKYRLECDKLFGRFIRSIGYCEKCGPIKRDSLQCAHILSKGGIGGLHLRYDLQNAVCLCYFHHIFWAHNKRLDGDLQTFHEWLERKYPGRMEYLKSEARKVELHFDWPKKYEELKQLVKGL